MIHNSGKPIRWVSLLRVWLIFATVCAGWPAVAATPYEAQLAGRLYAILITTIIGEFGGRTRANDDVILNRRLCEPRDYDYLKEAANNNATLIAFHQRCALVKTEVDDVDIHSVAHLPAGYCEKLKSTVERLFYDDSGHDPSGSIVAKHKALRLNIGMPDSRMVRRAKVRATCQDNGMLRVNAPRKRKT